MPTVTSRKVINHNRKPDRKIRVQPEDLQFEIKGATEYVDGAATVLLLERLGHVKDESGKFVNSSDDSILYFPKVKDAPAEFKPMHLRFFRDELLFKPLANRDEAENDGWFT